MVLARRISQMSSTWTSSTQVRPVAQWLQLIRPVYERSRVRLASETYMSQIKYKKYVVRYSIIIHKSHFFPTAHYLFRRRKSTSAPREVSIERLQGNAEVLA